MKFRHFLSVALLLGPTLMFAQSAPASSKATPAVTSAAAFPVLSEAAKNRSRQLYRYFEAGQTSQFYAAFTPQLKKARSLAQLNAMRKSFAAQLGNEEKVLGENFAPELGSRYTVYARYSKFAKAKDAVFSVLVIDETGEIMAFQPRPVPEPQPNRFSDYKVQTKLRLPFEGEWFVLQGGPYVYQNIDAYREAERYTLSFSVLKDGQAFAADGTKNEQFYCFGQPVTAPADGTVVQVNNRFVDNLPGHPAEVGPIGNRVILSHGSGEYSLFMHLKQNSVKVKYGDKVKQGDTLAECGNSGNSAYPHLEYRLQNSSGRPLPSSLPVTFVDYAANGKAEAAGQPVRGEFVKNVSAAAASTAARN